MIVYKMDSQVVGLLPATIQCMKPLKLHKRMQPRAGVLVLLYQRAVMNESYAKVATKHYVWRYYEKHGR